MSNKKKKKSNWASTTAKTLVNLPGLPVIEIRHVKGEGHYVVVEGKQCARTKRYEDAVWCSAQITTREIQKLTTPEIQRLVA
jgi:hypothetical protein